MLENQTECKDENSEARPAFLKDIFKDILYARWMHYLKKGTCNSFDELWNLITAEVNSNIFRDTLDAINFDQLKKKMMDTWFSAIYKYPMPEVWEQVATCALDKAYASIASIYPEKTSPHEFVPVKKCYVCNQHIFDEWYHYDASTGYRHTTCFKESIPLTPVDCINQYLISCSGNTCFPTIHEGTSIHERARQVAVRAHLGQKRWNGDDYVTHPIRVAGHFKQEQDDCRAVAYLHDVVEDTDLTLDDLRRFGFSEIIVNGVDAVTRCQGESYLNFILRAKEDGIGSQVKTADIKDNLRDLGKDKSTTRAKYELALWILQH